MKNIEGTILNTVKKESSGILFQADLYDLIQPLLTNISQWVNQTLTDIEYNPDNVKRLSFYAAKTGFIIQCRLIAEIIERMSGKKCYGYLETALDFPDSDITYPAGIRIDFNGEKKAYTVDMEMLFGIHRLSEPSEWYLEWATAYHDS